MESKCLFLDRDGIVNHDFGYVSRFDDIEFTDGIFEICRLARAAEFKIIIITNQSGIERGLFTQEDFEDLMDNLLESFAQQDCPISDYFYSPHMPADIGGGRVSGLQRKPSPEMIQVAAQRYCLDLKSSVLIGDKASDILAGHFAGIERLVLLGGDQAGLEDIRFQSIGNLKDFRPEWFLFSESP